MTTATRAYVSRLAGLPVFDPNGDRVGKVRDVVVALRVGTAAPRVLGLVVEVVAVLAEAGLFLYDPSGADGELGGVCLTPEAALDGVVVSWRQHDRMSLDQLHGAAADALVQQVMNRALAEVLEVRGFAVEPLGGACVVRVGESAE